MRWPLNSWFLKHSWILGSMRLVTSHMMKTLHSSLRWSIRDLWRDRNIVKSLFSQSCLNGEAHVNWLIDLGACGTVKPPIHSSRPATSLALPAFDIFFFFFFLTWKTSSRKMARISVHAEVQHSVVHTFLSSQVATDTVARPCKWGILCEGEEVGHKLWCNKTHPFLSVLDYRCLGSKAFLIQSRGIFVYLKNGSV